MSQVELMQRRNTSPSPPDSSHPHPLSPAVIFFTSFSKNFFSLLEDNTTPKRRRIASDCCRLATATTCHVRFIYRSPLRAIYSPVLRYSGGLMVERKFVGSLSNSYRKPIFSVQPRRVLLKYIHPPSTPPRHVMHTYVTHTNT